MPRLPLIPRTLRGRLVAAAGTPIIAAVVIFCAAAVLLVRGELHGSLDSALRTRAEDVAQLAVSAPAVLTRPGSLENPVSGRQIVVEVLDAGGRILARSLTLGARLLPDDLLARRARFSGQPGFETVRIAGREFRLYAAPIARAGGAAAGGVVLVASDTTDISSTVAHLTLVLTLSGAAAALLALLAAALLTRRELQPLRRLASAAGEIERTADPARRLPERPASRMQRDDVADLPRPPAGDEIDQLTGVLNRMLASLEVARASERRFLADASHELRTPVTTLLGNVEFLVRHGGDADLVAELKRDATRLARVVDDLLVLERAGTTIGEPVAVDLAQLVEEVVRRYAADHARLQLERLDGVAIRGDKDALARLLENLIDNALVHGPQGGRVSVNVRRDGDHARLTVSDEGPGPDPRYGQQLFERFWRAPEAAGRPGSGLGLSIVAAIAERHGARITVKGSTFAFDVPVMTEHALNH